MRRCAVLFCLLAGLGGPAFADDPIQLPSGQTVTYLDTIQNAQGPSGLTYRFRFVAPAIARKGGTIAADQAQDDMAWLCENYALPRLSTVGPLPTEIVISLSDVAVPFGEPAPDATQYFEAYTPTDGTCAWEGF